MLQKTKSKNIISSYKRIQRYAFPNKILKKCNKMPSIFLSTPIPNGHGWTIVSKFGHILQTAESKYRERDKSYTILGIEMTSTDNPKIWYPGNCKNVVIQITSSCLNDLNRAVYQVAHESIHCLYPTGNYNPNYLDEGLATHFSIEYTQANGHGPWSSGDLKYDEALDLVKQLFSIDSDIIKKLRQIEPCIPLVTKELLLKINSKISDDLASNLTRKF